MENEATTPIKAATQVNKIVILAMATVMFCLAIVTVIVAVNERSTQHNADLSAAQAQELQDELRCLRPTQLEFDKQQSEILIDLARALSALSDKQPIPPTLGDDLSHDADNVATALDAREAAITECRR